MSLFAGIDVGTSGGRCLIVDERGARVGFAERPWSYPRDESGFPTMDPDEVIGALADATTEALASCDPADVVSAGVTSQRHGLALIGDDEIEVALMPNFDGRAVAEALELERKHRDLIYRKTGRVLPILSIPARLAWLRAHRPDDAARVRRALPLADWLVWRMTGVAQTEPTLATETLLYDVAAGEWSDELLEALDVPRALLPPVASPGEPAGTAEAVEFGLLPATAVVSAGGDTQCGALALGVIEPEESFVVAGTTMLCGQVKESFAVDEHGRLWSSPHAIPGRFLDEVHCWEAGPAVGWIAMMLGVSVGELSDMAARAPASAGGLTFFDPMPSNATDFTMLRTGEIRFPSPLLALARTRDDVARAVFEGIAFGATMGLGMLGSPTTIAATGGVSRGEAFLAALAGATNQPIRASTEPQSAALGAAIVAAAGHHGGIREAAVAMHDRGREVAPRAEDGYPSLYAAWRERATELDARATRVSDFMG